MRNYKCLNIQEYFISNYIIIPIRDKDKYDIMKWRNEQIYHLRQSQILDKKTQDIYFENVISKLFDQTNPDQILFSLLENNMCIGYGGLVHINWLDKNAEISFVLDSNLDDKFIETWTIFLQLIEEVAFKELNFNKLYTFAFDLRPNLYIALESSNYTKEAVLKEHKFYINKFIDVVIHSKINTNTPFLRKAETYQDALKLYDWANDFDVRSNSINSEKISIVDHFNWFNKKIIDPNTKIFLLTNLFNTYIGQIRVDKINEYYEIDYSISGSFRRKGYGNKIVQLLLSEFPDLKLLAKVKKTNFASIKVFINNGFRLKSEENGIFIYIKN